jgi:hypothetical protein
LRPAIVCDDVQHLTVFGLQAAGHPDAESLIRLEDTQRALVTAARVLDPLGTFLRVEGASCQRIALRGNDLDLARQPVSLSDGTPADAVAQ